MATVILVTSIISTIVSVTGIVVAVAKTGATVGLGAKIVDAISIENATNIRGFDEPFLNAILQAIQMFYSCMSYVKTLITIFCFLFIVINAIKMWLNVQEVRKFFADAIYKCIICIILVNIFPAVMTKTMSIATKLGVEVSGGASQISTAFTTCAVNAKSLWEKGSKAYFTILTSGAEKDEETGLYKVNKELMDVFTKKGMTEEEARQLAEQNGISFVDKKELSGNFIAKWAEKKAKEKVINDYNELTKNGDAGDKEMRRALAVVNAMKGILTGMSDNEIVDGNSLSAVDLMNVGNETLETVFYDPFIAGSEDYLSTGSMVKTAVVLSEMLAANMMSPYDDSLDEEKISFKQMFNTFFGGVKSIGTIFKYFLFKVGMIIAVIFIMLEYVITIIEFYIVMALSSLLIPMFFLDATKSFAANIIRTVLSYFMKILVTVAMAFFSLNLLINGCINMMSEDMGAILWCLYYVYLLILTMTLVKGAGRIAGSVISGSPSLSLGELTREMHGMTHMAGSAARIAKETGANIQKGAQTVGTGALNVKNTLDGARLAQTSAMRGAISDAHKMATPYTREEVAQMGKQARNDYLAASFKQHAKDSIYTAGTGQKAEREKHDNVTFGKVGQTYVDKSGNQRTMSMGDIKDRNNEIAKNMGKGISDKEFNKYKEGGLSTHPGTQEFGEPNVRSGIGPDPDSEPPKIHSHRGKSIFKK